MTAADLDLLLAPRYRTIDRRPGHDVLLYEGTCPVLAEGARERALCLAQVETAQPDAQTLDVAADLAEDLGDDARATELRWRAVLLLSRARQLPLELVAGCDYVWVDVSYDHVQILTTRGIFRRDPKGWSTTGPAWSPVPCDPPACAPDVLAALRVRLAS